jgi:hypothetical protein
MINIDHTVRFPRAYQHLAIQMLQSTPLHIGEWQSKDVRHSKVHATYEMTDVTVRMRIPTEVDTLADSMAPHVNREWAEEHFLERTSGMPLNPPPSHERWPWSRHNGNHQTDDKFSHTYPERMWPKHAGEVDCHGSYVVSGPANIMPVDKYGQADDGRQVCTGRGGIRFAYGDLADVVNLLVRSPLTRQAYLPIWFPEDTGAVHGQRVPCTLGYHFMIRNGVLSCRYYMRSCDLIRHFADDVYLAARLTQWICTQWNMATYSDYRGSDGSPMDPPGFKELTPGELIMHISSLHAFVGDMFQLRTLAML